MLRFARIDFADGAPLRCVRCGVRQGGVADRSADDLVEAVTALATLQADTPGPNLLFAGGEPLEHPALPAVLDACAHSAAERIALETSAAALADPATARALVRAGVTHLRVVLLAADAETGDALAGHPVTAAAEAGITAFWAAAAESGQPVIVTAHVPVCPHNLALLPATVAALAARGFDAARLVHAVPLPVSAAVYIAAACDTGMVNRLWVETDGLLPLPDTHRLHALPEGGDGD